MTGLVTYDLNGQSAEALGHPTECTEPAPGSVTTSASHSVTVTNANGETKGLVIESDSPALDFPSHAHDHTSDEGCHQNESHNITALDSSKFSSSLTINGSKVMVVADGYATDPTTGGNVNVVGTGINNSLTGGES